MSRLFSLSLSSPLAWFAALVVSVVGCGNAQEPVATACAAHADCAPGSACLFGACAGRTQALQAALDCGAAACQASQVCSAGHCVSAGADSVTPLHCMDSTGCPAIAACLDGLCIVLEGEVAGPGAAASTPPNDPATTDPAARASAEGDPGNQSWEGAHYGEEGAPDDEEELEEEEESEAHEEEEELEF